MAWFPPLKLGWLNGWLLLGGFYGVFGLLMLAFPREVVQRLYDRTGWGEQVRVNASVARVIAILLFGYIFLSPLRTGTNMFLAGMAVYLLGFALMVVSLIQYRNTPLDEPVVDGVYRISRNPQWVSLVLVMLGLVLAIGSGVGLLMFILLTALGHFRVLAEESTCLDQYGEEYRAYMKKVPRYLLFF
jgi:protein-S-isoprenylcysteine O-methyltransferase Ste14